MTSPFSVFRRNQKLMLALLTILTVFGFVFLPTILDIMGGSKQVNPVAVTSKYGNLRERDLAWRHSYRLKVLQVISELLARAGMGAEEAYRRCEMLFGPPTEENLVDSWLLARRAEQLGMVVSNQVINSFLRQVTQNAVKTADIREAFRHAQVSDRQFFAMLREELLALQYRELFQPCVLAVTPGQRWDYYTRLKRQATIEAIALPAADYLDQVEEPSEEELRQFFEQHKQRLPDPTSPEPGFRRPQRIALEYIKAKVEKFADPQKISQEEIQSHYEKNRELYDQILKARKEAQKAFSEKGQAKEAPEKEKPGEQPTEEPQTPSGEKNESSAPQPPENSGSSTPPDADNSSSEKEQSKPESKEQAKGDFQPMSMVAVNAAEVAEPESGQPPVDKKPPVEEAEKSQSDAEKPSSPAEKPAAMPPEELLDRIRRDIAYERVQKIFDDLRVPLDQYREKRGQYEVSQLQGKSSGEPIGPPPPSPDFNQLAEQYGLTAHRTGLLSKWEAEATEIGAAFVGGSAPVSEYAFQSLPRFRAQTAMSLEGNLYLFWKTEDVKEHVPDFDDEEVRKEVHRAWQLIRARRLALEAAEKLAAKARESKKSLKETFADRPELTVIEPPPFTWLTTGSATFGFPQAMRINFVHGVELPGEDFMKTVFRLTPGEVAVAMNAPQTYAYVIRVVDFCPPYAVLWRQFEVDDFREYAVVGYEDQQKLMQAWLDELRDEAQLQWSPEHKQRRLNEVAEQ